MTSIRRRIPRPPPSASHPLARLFGGLQGDRSEARGPGLRGPRSQTGSQTGPYPDDLFDSGRSGEANVEYPEQWVAPSAAALAQGVELSDPQDTWGPEREMGPPGQPPVDPSSMLLQALAQLLGSAPGQLPRRRRPGPGRVPFE